MMSLKVKSKSFKLKLLILILAVDIRRTIASSYLCFS